MSNLPHLMVRRSERNPRAEADGGKDSSNESSVQPRAEMESNIVSSDTTTESQVTDSSDELTELVAVASSPSVSGSPGVRMGVSADAVPVPEVEPEALEANRCIVHVVGALTLTRLYVHSEAGGRYIKTRTSGSLL